MDCKPKQNLIVLLTFVALVAVVANNAALAQSTEWAVEVVDGGGDVESADLAYDPVGNPAIAYATDYQVKFAHRDSVSWVLEPIGAASGDNAISLAYDGEQPTVSYTNDGRLYFARRSASGGWDIELVDGSDDVLNRPVSLAYDNSGNPSISYCAGTKNPAEAQTVLKFAHWNKNSESWDIEIVVDAPWTRYISLAYDSAGKPAIAYMDMTGRNRRTRIYFVKLARWNEDSSSWDIETVDSMSDPYIGFFIDLAFDPISRDPSIVYCKDSVTLHFARYDGSSWESEWIGSGIRPSLAYNSSGTAFVSYYDFIEGVLNLAQRNAVSGDWETEIADWVYNVTSTSIAIDPAGNPAVRYNENHILKFAWRGPFNARPTVTIDSPLDGVTFDSGATIDFLGTASDLEDGFLTDYLVWESDIQGDIGVGGHVQAMLIDGYHTITASVTDSGGKTGDASVVITVGELPLLHVEDIAMNSGKAGPNYYALATVWVMDNVGDVEGATVSGEWSGAVSGTATGVTDADGKVTLQSPKKKKGGTFIFTVTDVEAPGYIYDEALNAETSDSVTAP